MTTVIIGTGLIGGSMAMALKEKGLADRVIGVDANSKHAAKALELGLVDEITALEEAIPRANLVIISVPVNALLLVLPRVLDLADKQVIMDVGSTKGAALAIVDGHPKRDRFVATHPMWGTEYSGPEAAVAGAFRGRAAVICDAENSAADALSTVKELYTYLGMHLVYMNAKEHDLHVAYVSHISHVTSFALANTVLEKEREAATIFELASGGFESTVRLAKSHPAMWTPIFRENRANILDVLKEHIHQLTLFRDGLEADDEQFLNDWIAHANGIRRIIR